jgi:hypothetical protein
MTDPHDLPPFELPLGAGVAALGVADGVGVAALAGVADGVGVAALAGVAAGAGVAGVVCVGVLDWLGDEVSVWLLDVLVESLVLIDAVTSALLPRMVGSRTIWLNVLSTRRPTG